MGKDEYFFEIQTNFLMIFFYKNNITYFCSNGADNNKFK